MIAPRRRASASSRSSQSHCSEPSVQSGMWAVLSRSRRWLVSVSVRSRPPLVVSRVSSVTGPKTIRW
ncbi:MAG: hypothetical protein EBX36_03750 [Planctomycetia bacterium]|nr:hypothetical protein [Planctomycetia bacterium]